MEVRNVSLKSEMDPTGAYGKPDEMVERCGLIPYFWLDAILSSPSGAGEVMDGMLKAYTFGSLSSAFDDCNVTPEGVYQSPYEEDLAPFMRLVAEDTTEDGTALVAECFIYPYGLVAVRDNHDTLITRMD